MKFMDYLIPKQTGLFMVEEYDNCVRKSSKKRVPPLCKANRDEPVDRFIASQMCLMYGHCLIFRFQPREGFYIWRFHFQGSVKRMVKRFLST